MSIKENKTTIVYLLITYPIKKEEYGTKNEVNIKSENTQKVFMDKIENDNFNHYNSFINILCEILDYVVLLFFNIII